MQLDGLLTALREAQHVCVLTGAGISAESGVPTFRDAQSGLWQQYDPLDLATPDAFVRDPELIWRWYRWRRELVAKAEPNPGHLALARLAELVPRFTLVTQNVDGLHQRAGSTDVIEFHGNLFSNRCFVEGCIFHGEQDGTGAVPVCPDCGGLGYKGRLAIFEFVKVTDEMRQALIEQPRLDVLRKLSRKAGNRTLQEEGVLLVAQGVTAINELQRALKQ